MIDDYLIGRIAQLRGDIHPLSHKALELAEQEEERDHLIKSGVSLIVAKILEKYQKRANIQVHNLNFRRVVDCVGPYGILSCQVHYKNHSGKEFIIDTKHLDAWDEVGLAKKDHITIYAQDIHGNPRYANSVVETMSKLISEEKKLYMDPAHSVFLHGSHSRLQPLQHPVLETSV